MSTTIFYNGIQFLCDINIRKWRTLLCHSPNRPQNSCQRNFKTFMCAPHTFLTPFFLDCPQAFRSCKDPSYSSVWMKSTLFALFDQKLCCQSHCDYNYYCTEGNFLLWLIWDLGIFQGWDVILSINTFWVEIQGMVWELFYREFWVIWSLSIAHRFSPICYKWDVLQKCVFRLKENG